MNYDPPSETNWVGAHRFCPDYREAYDEGYLAAQQGKSLDDNPYPESGHERDTSHSDELNYWWYSGWMDSPTLEEKTDGS